MNKENSMIMVNGGAFFKLPHQVMIDPELIYDEYNREYRVVITFMNSDQIEYKNVISILDHYTNITNETIDNYNTYYKYTYYSISIKNNTYCLGLSRPKIHRYNSKSILVYELSIDDSKDLNYKGNIYESDEIRYARGNS